MLYCSFDLGAECKYTVIETSAREYGQDHICRWHYNLKDSAREGGGECWDHQLKLIASFGCNEVLMYDDLVGST